MSDVKDYIYLRAWNRMMGSASYYSQQKLEEARKDNAPAEAIYKNMDGTWETFDKITNVNTRALIQEMIENQLR
jgi:hypothetical protein